jgi:hypothetical protein
MNVAPRNGDELNRSMVKITCVSGLTQLGRIFTHARKEADQGNVKAVVFVGDAFEENIEDMLGPAQALGLKGVPVFVLQEGDDPTAERAFKMIAHASGGLHLRFDADAPAQMQRLLAAVGAYLVTGDMKEIRALANHSGSGKAPRIGPP